MAIASPELPPVADADDSGYGLHPGKGSDPRRVLMGREYRPASPVSQQKHSDVGSNGFRNTQILEQPTTNHERERTIDQLRQIVSSFHDFTKYSYQQALIVAGETSVFEGTQQATRETLARSLGQKDFAPFLVSEEMLKDIKVDERNIELIKTLIVVEAEILTPEVALTGMTNAMEMEKRRIRSTYKREPTGLGDTYLIWVAGLKALYGNNSLLADGETLGNYKTTPYKIFDTLKARFPTKMFDALKDKLPKNQRKNATIQDLIEQAYKDITLSPGFAERLNGVPSAIEQTKKEFEAVMEKVAVEAKNPERTMSFYSQLILLAPTISDLSQKFPELAVLGKFTDEKSIRELVRLADYIWQTEYVKNNPKATKEDIKANKTFKVDPNGTFMEKALRMIQDIQLLTSYARMAYLDTNTEGWLSRKFIIARAFGTPREERELRKERFEHDLPMQSSYALSQKILERELDSLIQGFKIIDLSPDDFSKIREWGDSYYGDRIREFQAIRILDPRDPRRKVIEQTAGILLKIDEVNLLNNDSNIDEALYSLSPEELELVSKHGLLNLTFDLAIDARKTLNGSSLQPILDGILSHDPKKFKEAKARFEKLKKNGDLGIRDEDEAAFTWRGKIMQLKILIDKVDELRKRFPGIEIYL